MIKIISFFIFFVIIFPHDIFALNSIAIDNTIYTSNKENIEKYIEYIEDDYNKLSLYDVINSR